MTFETAPYRIEEALRLSQSLGLSRPLAVALARRGLGDPEQASLFLEGSESHEPGQFRGMDAAVAETLGVIKAGRRVTVYGDFDADGVAATTIMVSALRQLGADCDWFIPDRISEGYGLNAEAIRDLQSRGTGLVITVDCGITSVEEVALAKSLGMEIIVTDHHRPGDQLPGCTVLHPEVNEYPFRQLCGAAVAAKFSSALREAGGVDPAADEEDLDLVALATVADVMPLVGENRRLVKEGLKVARRALRPGMRALIAECRLEPSRLASEDLGFRLGPRINAAGRIYRADAGVELFLCESDQRAGEIAGELGRANSERRRIEREVETAAEAARRELAEGNPSALVLAGEGWHPGVVGIVAAKLARRHSVPAVIISIDGDLARGSARGIVGLDLHAAIGSVSGLLEGFGGHAAAAGLQIRTERIPEFRQALSEVVAGLVESGGVSGLEGVDAFVGGNEIAMDLAVELEKLEPCGKGNPALTLLVPSAKVTDIREIGEGKHCRFTVASAGSRAAGVSFGRTGFGVDEDTSLDLLAELSVNHWNGSSEAQLRVIDAGEPAGPDEDGDVWEGLAFCAPAEWWERFEAATSSALGLDPEGRESTGRDSRQPMASTATASAAPGRALDASPETGCFDGPTEVVMAELISSGEPLLILTSDVPGRWKSFGGASGIGRFRAGHGPAPLLATGLCDGSPADSVASFTQGLSTGVGLCDFESLLRWPEVARAASGLLLLDPPADAVAKAGVFATGLPVYSTSDPASQEFALLAAADRHSLTPQLRALYRLLRDRGSVSSGGEVGGQELLEVLSGSGEATRSPERAALLLAILVQAGLARSGGSAGARSAGIVSSGKVDLTDSPIFCEQERLHKEQVEFLRQSKR